MPAWGSLSNDEKNALVAEHIFGWHHFRKGVHWNYVQGRSLKWCADETGPALVYGLIEADVTDPKKEPDSFRANWVEPDHYVQDIGWAFRVLNKLREEGYDVTVGSNGPGFWFCEIAKPSDAGSDVEIATTPAEAICMAALACKGHFDANGNIETNVHIV